MNDPFADDGWDELTRELGVEKAPPAADPLDDEAPPEPFEEDPALATGDEFDAGLESEGDAPDGVDAPEEGPLEPGKKRRRRRRRRKKGPGEGEGTESASETGTAAAVPAEDEFEDAEYETGPGSETDELTPVLVGSEEDTAGEVLRDLIANWNVPSWDSIITGLYRPER